MRCRKCNEIVAEAQRFCPACGTDAGFPNVRLAQQKRELTELKARVQTAQTSAIAAGYGSTLNDFGNSVSTSKAIVARPLRVLFDLIESEQQTYSSYHKQLNAGTRLPADDIFDQTRVQFENALFPNFFDEICYAALTLDDTWLAWFGDYGMILKDSMIAHRTTVFEENPFIFARRLKLSLTETTPPGYRATWNCRQDIAKAKLHSKLNSNTQSKDYPGILMDSSNKNYDADYIEVHIFGTFTRAAIDKILGREPQLRENRVLWRSFKITAQKAGVTVKET